MHTYVPQDDIGSYNIFMFILVLQSTGIQHHLQLTPPPTIHNTSHFCKTFATLTGPERLVVVGLDLQSTLRYTTMKEIRSTRCKDPQGTPVSAQETKLLSFRYYNSLVTL